MQTHWAGKHPLTLYSFPELNPHRLLVIVHTHLDTHTPMHARTHELSVMHKFILSSADYNGRGLLSKAKPNSSPSIPTVLLWLALYPQERYQRGQLQKKESSLLDTAQDWKKKVDLDQKLTFPPEIITTSFRPDLIPWSASQRALFIIELAVPWEDAVCEAYECKTPRYTDLANEAEQKGWRTQVFPVEVSCRIFLAMSTTRPLKWMGVQGQALQQAIK